MTQRPDTELLDLCTRLQAMQAEWQRLYDATSEEPGLTIPADHAWAEYSKMVWPGVKISSDIFHPQPHPDDLPGRLVNLPGTTPGGQAVKAKAILALDYAAGWCDCRDDTIELLRDVAARGVS